MQQLTLILKLNSNIVRFVNADGYQVSFLEVHYHSGNVDELRCLVERIQVTFDTDTPFSIVQELTNGVKEMKRRIRQTNTTDYKYTCGNTHLTMSAMILFPDSEKESL